MAYIRTSIEDTELSDPETIRKRLRLDSNDWLEYFTQAMLEVIRLLVRRFPRIHWSILIDETTDPFYGNMDEYLEHIGAKQEANPLIRQYISSYRPTRGTTGSFQFLAMALRSKRGLFTFYVQPIYIGMKYTEHIEEVLAEINRIVPKAPILADRGFPSVDFFNLLQKLNLPYVIRLPKKGKLKRTDKKKFYHTYNSANKKVKFYVIRGLSNNVEYFFASTYKHKSFKWHRLIYKGRWGIENAFKYADKAMLSTSSKDIRMRLFCQVLSLFLVSLWYLERVLEHVKISFRKFVKSFILTILKLFSQNMLNHILFINDH